ncbi:glucose-1-dehydrogenase like protein [Zymoseptoria brevis]|uniref:Glucose-1-dehydrogenase like protein n=1 Tax=Zymoseptoria brevis TaxID=1047168 RepID=A0A0F4GT84_9PEZI|nr:glucose-1-dehydrogenase like protein [Zymoseptoria brevis]
MSSPPLNVLITGASRGIGRASAILAGERHWNIGINYVRDVESAKSCQAEVQAFGGQAIIVAADMKHEDQVRELFDAVEKEYGTLDGVVINAGITAQAMPLADMDIERLKRVFDTNILGAYLCAREAARRMPASKGGRGGSIVFVSSAAARLGSPNEYVDYAGSKGAIDTLTTGLAKELGPLGIRVNSVRPGIIRTDIHELSGHPSRVDRLGNQAPMGRAGEAGEVAEAIVWLLSPASSYVTGTFIDVAGGR